MARKKTSTKLLSDLMRRDEKGILVPLVRKFLFDLAMRAHLDPSEEKAFTIDVYSYKKAFMDEMLKQYTQRKARVRGKGEFHPSQLFGCERAIWLSVLGAPSNAPCSATDELRKHLIFSMGDSVHLRWQTILTLVGVLEKAEVPVENKKYDLIGHCDGILNINGERMALEIKSINSMGFSRLTEPKEDHVRQVSIYMDCLGLEKGIILYENKDRHEVKEYVIKKSKKVVREYKQVIDRVKIAINENVPPKKESPTPNSTACRWCNYTHICHTEAKMKLFQDKKKGKSYASQSKKKTKVKSARFLGKKIRLSSLKKVKSSSALREFVGKG